MSSPRRLSLFFEKDEKPKLTLHTQELLQNVARSVGCDVALVKKCIAGHIFKALKEPKFMAYVTIPIVKTRRNHKWDEGRKSSVKQFFKDLASMLNEDFASRLEEKISQCTNFSERVDEWNILSEVELSQFLQDQDEPGKWDLFHLFSMFPTLRDNPVLLQEVPIVKHFFKMEKVLNDARVKSQRLVATPSPPNKKMKKSYADKKVEKDQVIDTMSPPSTQERSMMSLSKVFGTEVEKELKAEPIAKLQFVEKANVDEVLLVFPFPFDVKRSHFIKASKGLTEADGKCVSSHSESLFYNNNPNMVIKAVTGKREKKHQLTIRGHDFNRLKDGVFVSDTIIDFWSQW